GSFHMQLLGKNGRHEVEHKQQYPFDNFHDGKWILKNVSSRMLQFSAEDLLRSRTMTVRCISIRCLSRRAALLVLETSQSMSKSIRGARWENSYPSRNLFGWRTATGTVVRSPAVENALKLH